MTILGILAVSALPNFTSVVDQSEITSRDATVGAVQIGLQMFRANNMVTVGPPGIYPDKLDDVGVNTPCTNSSRCFGNVLISSIADYKSGTGWEKVSDARYVFRFGATAYTYDYDLVAGTFTQQ